MTSRVARMSAAGKRVLVLMAAPFSHRATRARRYPAPPQISTFGSSRLREEAEPTEPLRRAAHLTALCAFNSTRRVLTVRGVRGRSSIRDPFPV